MSQPDGQNTKIHFWHSKCYPIRVYIQFINIIFHRGSMKLFRKARLLFTTSAVNRAIRGERWPAVFQRLRHLEPHYEVQLLRYFIKNIYIVHRQRCNNKWSSAIFETATKVVKMENLAISVILHVLWKTHNLRMYEFSRADQEKHETPNWNSSTRKLRNLCIYTRVQNMFTLRRRGPQNHQVTTCLTCSQEQNPYSP
jgi:hypothetical protein